MLKKEGITVVKKLDTLRINSIATKIANKLCAAFPEHGFSQLGLFSSLSRLDMYLAKFEDNLCGAKYFYGNSSIYFNIDYSLSNADIFALHECLHYIQEVKDSDGNLLRLGLYDLVNNEGLAINEAAVQLMTAEALGNPMQNVSYYGLDFPSNSPDCYPLECAILSQMVYFTGTYRLYHSTLNGNDIFKNTFIALSSAQTYSDIEKNLNKLVNLENNLAMYSNEIQLFDGNPKGLKKLNSSIEKTKKEIMSLFMNCQGSIISHCFSKDLEGIRINDDIQNLKNKLYKFKDYIATYDGYDFYNEFYRNTMEALDKKASFLEEHGPFAIEGNSITDLTVVSKAKGIIAFFRKLRKLLGLAKESNF